MTTSSAPRRPFRYQHPHGKFYSPLDGGEWTAPFGVWELRGTADVAPEGLYGVRLEQPDGGGPSDEPGLTWQDRAIRAEMQCASLRAAAGEAERRQGDAEHDRRVLERAAAKEARQLRAELAMQRNQLFELAGRIAKVYDREFEFMALQEPDVDDPENIPHEPTFGELHDFMAETLRRDHPATQYPTPSPDSVAVAVVQFRTSIGEGATIEEAVEVTLARMVARQRADQQHADAPPTGYVDGQVERP